MPHRTRPRLTEKTDTSRIPLFRREVGGVKPIVNSSLTLVVAVRGGLLSLEDACKRYTLTVEEFLAWQRAIERFGLPGLRATRVQQYRH